MDINKYLKPFKFQGSFAIADFLSYPTFHMPYHVMLKSTFSTHKRYSSIYPFDKLIYRELWGVGDLTRHSISTIISLIHTNLWVFKPQFIYKEIFASSPVAFRYYLVESKKFATLVFKYHPEIYFRLHKLDYTLLNYAESKEDALIAAITTKLIGVE